MTYRPRHPYSCAPSDEIMTHEAAQAKASRMGLIVPYNYVDEYTARFAGGYATAKAYPEARQ